MSATPDITTFKVLTFDCYGTLIDWERGILDALGAWARTGGIPAADDAKLEAFGETESQVEAETPRVLYPEILQEVLRRLGRRWGTPVTPAQAIEFGRSVRNWAAFPDSPEALRYLQKHYKLVILSNVDHDSFAHSKRKLGVTFDLVLTAQDIGSYKPDLRNFEYALAHVKAAFGVDRDGILHVAQSVFHDIVPARTIGLHTVWVNRRKAVGGGWGATPAPQTSGQPVRPDVEVSSLQELAARHQSMLRGSAV